MRNYKTEAIIIKRRNVQEADRLLTVITQEGEKLYVKAKGVRRITSRRSSHIELINLSLLSLYKNTNTAILTEAQTIQNFEQIKMDLTKTGLAYHMCELIDGLCPIGVVQPGIFTLFHQALCSLETASEPLLLLHEFEVRLLTLLGYWHGTTETSLSLNTHDFIESILEKKLKSHKIFSRL